MPAIKVHHTETSDEAWDVGANRKRLPNDERALRAAHAWYDPDGDPEAKETYKFLHHFVSADGEVGAASLRACSNGIAVLNGGRGGADIPDGDRDGVWRHLAAHLRDADREPPELKEWGAEEELRVAPAVMEVREGEDAPPVLEGYAAVFGELSLDLGGFREVIMPGAFSESLGGDIRAVWNHDAKYVLGRTSNGTLQITEDDRGLRVRIYPPDTTWARDLLVSIRRGDVSQMSFAFRVPEGGEEWHSSGDMLVRKVHKVELIEVSPVTFPAYPQTSIHVRQTVQEFIARACDDADKAEASQGRALLETLKRKVELLEREI